MKITRISVWQLDLPLTEPYWLSGGRLKFEKLDSTYVRIETDTGLVGWGEGCPWGETYLPAHGPGIRAGIQTIAPALIGKDPTAIGEINRAMDIALPGHPYVKSAIDIACWDILGQKAELPIWRLLGAEEAATIEVNSSISTGSADDMLALIDKARSKGYRTHSCKVGGSDINVDVDRIKGVSSGKADDDKITFDVNRAWLPGVAISVLNSVNCTDWVEQPCQTMAQCAHVAKQVPNPIMLDECLHTFQDHLDAYSHGVFEGIKVKTNRLGGITKCKQVMDFACSVGWQMHIEDVGGSALADTAAMHMAASLPQENRLASWLCHYHLNVDPVPGQGARNKNGIVQLDDRPGLGVKGDLNFLGDPFAVYGA